MHDNNQVAAANITENPIFKKTNNYTVQLLTPYLKVKPSTLPGAGKGLFTKVFIPKGMMITEHTGKITTMKEAALEDDNNAYLFYVSARHVIDGKDDKKMVARYANDAMGFTRVPGLKNNAQYVVEDKRVFIVATKDIPKGGEIFVGYGKEYWAVLKKNFKLQKKAAL